MSREITQGVTKITNAVATYVPTYERDERTSRTRRSAPQDARGASVGGKAIVTAWVDACRRIGRTYGTDGRSLAILGKHANRLLLMGVPPRELLEAIQEYVIYPRSNPARIANWLAVLDEKADPTGKKAWAKLAVQMREAGLSITGLRAMR